MDDQELTLSVVATSRNDDHGANLLRRMQTFTNAFINQCKRHNLRAELILVEWNPPADRPRLAEALKWPADPSPCVVRIVEVPEHLHRRLKCSESLPLFQMIAKNVGIRRARGRFVLATNIDIVFNDELIRFLKEERLERGKLYRIDRTDVETFVPQDGPVEEQLAYCRTHQIRVNTRQGTFPVTPDGKRFVEGADIASKESGIILQDGASQLERRPSGELFRWAGDDLDFLVTGPDEPRRLLVDLSPGPSVARFPMELEVLDGDEVVARGSVLGRGVVSLALPIAPGEFKVFRMRAVDGGLPAPNWDPRSLDFALFKLAWSEPVDEPTPESPEAAFGVSEPELAPRGDVISSAAGIRLGQGWHPLETKAGLISRCAESGASLRVERPAEPGLKLKLWLAASTCLRLRGRATLQVRDERGGILFEGRISSTPRRVTLSAPTGRITFHLHDDGVPVAPPNAARALRLFSCCWSDAPWKERAAGSVRARVAGPGLLLRGLARAVRRGFARTLARTLSRRYEVTSERARRNRPAGGDTGCGAYQPPKVHTNACGDFTLMAREDWFALWGYAELEIFSMHLDSLFLYAAHCAGYEEVVLSQPMRAYHIEHSAGSGWTPEGEKTLFERLRVKGIPALSVEDVLALARSMQVRNNPLLFNKSDWGLADENLPETRIGGPARCRRAA